jgi:hypothetical protein
VGVPVVGDPAAFGVDVVTLLAVPSGRDTFEVSEQPGLERRVRQAVDPPDHHGCPADHAVGHPAVFILVVPVAHPLGGAEQAILRRARSSRHGSQFLKKP